VGFVIFLYFVRYSTSPQVALLTDVAAVGDVLLCPCVCVLVSVCLCPGVRIICNFLGFLYTGDKSATDLRNARD
jgi:hypothetical protein